MFEELGNSDLNGLSHQIETDWNWYGWIGPG